MVVQSFEGDVDSYSSNNVVSPRLQLAAGGRDKAAAPAHLSRRFVWHCLL